MPLPHKPNSLNYDWGFQFNPSKCIIYASVYICRHLKPLSHKQHSWFCTKIMVGTLYQNVTCLKPICCSDIHSSIKCLFKDSPHTSCLCQTIPTYFSSFMFVLTSQSISLGLKPKCLQCRDSIVKNLTQVLQRWVLKFLEALFKRAYKNVRILTWHGKQRAMMDISFSFETRTKVY